MSIDDGGRPSRESLREVKREYKARQKAEQQRAKDAQAYWDTQTRRGRRRPGWVVPAAVVATVAVVAAGGMYALKATTSGSSSTTAAAATGSARTATASATSKATPKPSPTDAGTDPTVHAAFEGSPARSWKKGMAGIAQPKAHTIGIYRTVQVAAAYRMAENYIAASVFDPHVLYKGQLSPVLTVLNPGFPTFATQQHALWVKTHGKQGLSWLSLMSRFHPGDWKAAAETRSRGHISPATLRKGALRVSFTIVAAYWLVPAKGGAARTVAVRRQGYLDFIGNGPTRVWMSEWMNSWMNTGAVCGSSWKYPEYLEVWNDRSSVVSTIAAQGGPGFDLTDPDAALPGGATCFTDTSGFGS